jgi:S1-C subfamily serine protease
MTQPAFDLHALDRALADAVATIAPSVLHVRRGPGQGGTALAWAPDLAIASSFHTPDTTKVGIAAADGDLDHRDAEVIGRDPGSDVALLRVAGGGLAPAALRDLDGLAVGNLAIAVGRPGRSARASLRAIGVLGPELKTPWGRLERYVESDRQIPRGFAGGPLIDADGAVIGMNTRTLIRNSDLAIPAVTLRRVVAELLAHGAVRRGYLGIGAFPAALPPSIAQLVGRGRAALVTGLDDGGPAATAGVLVGDLIVALDGQPVEGPDSLREAVADRGGKTVPVELVRGGGRVTLDVAIGSKP